MARPGIDMENHYLRAKLMEEYSEEVEGGEEVYVWLGLRLKTSERNEETRWIFPGSLESEYRDYLKDDPNTSYDEALEHDCTTFYGNKEVSSYFHWVTQPCNARHPFICEFDL